MPADLDFVGSVRCLMSMHARAALFALLNGTMLSMDAVNVDAVNADAVNVDAVRLHAVGETRRTGRA